MATHSGVLAWRIPGMGEPSGLPFMGSHRVGHDWSDLAAVCYWGFPHGSDDKEPVCNAGDLDQVPGSGRSHGEGNSTQCSILAWIIPWTEEAGREQSMRSQTIRHDQGLTPSLMLLTISNKILTFISQISLPCLSYKIINTILNLHHSTILIWYTKF